MTDGEKWAIRKLLIKLSAFYDKSMPDEVVNMYCEVLSDLNFAEINRAVDSVIRDPKITRMPLPAQLRQTIRPVLTEAEEAKHLAAKIISCVAKHGYVWAQGFYSQGELLWTGKKQFYKSWQEAIESEVGPIGAEVIKSIGGWGPLCERANRENVGVLQSQLSGLAETIIKKVKAGTLDNVGQLPEREEQKSVPSNIKQLITKENG